MMCVSDVWCPWCLCREFKSVLGKHAAQFQGYEQHDSQELLSYLLDMLHEDINRIKQKPYIEEADNDEASDDVLAGEAWANYRCVVSCSWTAPSRTFLDAVVACAIAVSWT